LALSTGRLPDACQAGLQVQQQFQGFVSAGNPAGLLIIMTKQRPVTLSDAGTSFLNEWRQEIISRRPFLARMAGVSVAALFPLPGGAATSSPQSKAALLENQQAVLAAGFRPGWQDHRP
jgi:hypothetical protein